MIQKLLQIIEQYDNIIITGHDYPDPDALASCHILTALAKQHYPDKNITHTYNGYISRAENLNMMTECNIHPVDINTIDVDKYQYLIMIDTQPTSGNIYIPTNMEVIGIIDHHSLRNESFAVPFCDIRNSGSASSIIASYCQELRFPLTEATGTALFYGVKTDTMGTARKIRKFDELQLKYLAQYTSFEKLSHIESVSRTPLYYETVCNAYINSELVQETKFLMSNLGSIDSLDITGETSDFLISNKALDGVISVGSLDNFSYFSLRYKPEWAHASEIAGFLALGNGTGGGYKKTAGGRIGHTETLDNDAIYELLKRRLVEFFQTHRPSSSSSHL